jgi:hypothetical protein
MTQQTASPNTTQSMKNNYITSGGGGVPQLFSQKIKKQSRKMQEQQKVFKSYELSNKFVTQSGFN